MNLIKKKPFTEVLSTNSLDVDFEKMSRDSWVQFLSRNFSFITKNFFAQFRSQITCRECQKISLSFEPYQIISLAIPTTITQTLAVFLISPHQSKKAIKLTMNIKYQNYSEFAKLTVEQFIARIAIERELAKERLMMFFLGFSVPGDYVPNETKLSDLIEKNKNPDYRPRLFILELSEDEYERRINPNCMMIMGLVNCDNSTFNKTIQVLPTTTGYDIYFEFFKKFAHFYESECRRDSYSDIATKVDYVEAFEREIASKPEGERDFTVIKNGKVIPMDKTLSIFEFFSEEDFEGKGKVAQVVLQFRVNSEEKIFFNRTKQCDILDLKDYLIEDIQSENQKQSIDQLMENLSKPEDLDEHNEVYCSNCKKTTLISKKFEIYNTPKNLIVHFKKLKIRFHDEMNLDIGFKLDGFDMTDHVVSGRTVDDLNIEVDEFAKDNLISDINLAELNKKVDRGNKRLIYDCYGVINHTGSQYFGHYTAYAKNEGKWIYYDDDRYTEVKDLDEIVSSRAYVLFYRLRE